MTSILFLFPAGIFLLALLLGRLARRGPNGNSTQDAWFKEFLPAVLAAVLAFLGLLFVDHFVSLHFLAHGPEENSTAESSPWTSLIYFAAMVLGMVAQVIFRSIQQRRGRQAPTIDKWEFVKPALVAPIVFITVYHNITTVHITAIMLLFSFQNGFFWQTVLRK
jgi:hypothetical protein